jgi:hypothetical protein
MKLETRKLKPKLEKIETETNRLKLGARDEQVTSSMLAISIAVEGLVSFSRNLRSKLL